MKTTNISTLALSEATRISRTKLQAKLVVGQKEATTGRLADVGQSLGYMTGRSVSMRQELERLNTFKDTNSVASSRLQLTQTTLENAADSAQAFLSTLIVARSTPSASGVTLADAKAKLTSLIGAINTAANGAFIYSGINTDVRPLTEYFDTPTPANRQAVATEFLNAFGIPQSDPAAVNITGGDMQAFLDGPFSALFDPAGWTATWSQASDQNITTRISTNELIETSTNANAEPIRMLASAYTMIADLGIESLNEEAYQVVIDKAIALVGEAISALTSLRAALGTAEERIKTANERMSIQITIITEHINLLEGVDPFEASSRVSALLTQVETAYALTARLQRLSLINYL